MPNKLTLNRLLTLAISLLLAFLTVGVKAESRLFPGFLFVESAYLEQGSDLTSADAYITVTNLHPEDPLVLLTASSEIFEGATFFDDANAEMTQVVIQPGERLAGLRVALSGVDLTDSSGAPVEFSFLIRRGLEAMEAVDAIETNNGPFGGGIKAREAGIPNEDEYTFRVDIRD